MYSLGDIRKNINSTHISDLIPIEKLNAENNHLYKEYMLSALTYEDIIKEYPFLNGEPLYASKSISNPCYYYDEESLFPISLYATTDETGGMPITKASLCGFQTNKSIEDEYKEGVKYIKEKFKAGKGLFFVGSDTMAFEFLKSNLDNMGEDKIFNMAMDLYLSCDYGFGVLGDDVFRKIANCRNSEQTNELNINLSKYLNENNEITIYRGEGEYSTENGYSYSLDINIAVFFATRYTSSKKAKVIKGKAKKEDVVWYSNERGEQEIIVYPDKVYNKEEIQMHTCHDDIIHFSMECALDIYQCYRATLKEFPYEHRGTDHNKEHMLRVLFLGLLMVIRECPEIHLKNKDAHTLAIALSLHDIGRDNDIDDTEHGIKSYEIFKKHFRRITKLSREYYNDEWVKFLMEYHCKDDELAIKEIKKMNLDFDDRIKLMSFYNILKDADALDRVRFGIKCLDVDYLRLKNSIKYVLFANQLINSLEL